MTASAARDRITAPLATASRLGVNSPAMSHACAYTLAAITNPKRFAALYPTYAGLARELVRTRPDCRELRFSCGHVSALPHTGGAVHQVSVSLESKALFVVVEVSGEPLAAKIVHESARWPASV